MDTEHVWAERKLPLAASGILDEAEEGRLRAHVGACEECSERWSDFAAMPLEDSEHIPAVILARWPRSKAELSALERELAERHLARCGDCGEELRLTERRIQRAKVRASLGAPHLVSAAILGALAASLTLLLLNPGQGLDDDIGGGRAIPWAVPSELRGPGATEIEPDAREIALTLATPPSFDRSLPAQAVVFDADGHQVAMIAVPSEQLRRSSLFLVVGSATPLLPGEYTVELSQQGATAVRLRFALEHHRR